MAVITPKQLAHKLAAETDLQQCYTPERFAVHALFVKVFKHVKHKLKKDGTARILDHYTELFHYSNYPHNSYTKLCIFVGMYHYMPHEQLSTYLNSGFWELFFDNPKSTTPTINMELYVKLLLRVGASYKNNMNEDVAAQLLVGVVDPSCRCFANINVIWPTINVLLDKINLQGWDLFAKKFSTALVSELTSTDSSSMSLYCRSNFILFLKMASVCKFYSCKYTKESHLEMSTVLLRIALQCSHRTKEFQMMGCAFMNSLLSIYSRHNEIAYFRLMIESRRFFKHQPTHLRLKFALMVKIISKFRTKVRDQKGPIEFLHLCYVVYFGSLFQSTEAIKTLRDIVIAYKYGYWMAKRGAIHHWTSQPYWLDVVVEIVLSLLVQPNRWSKRICFLTFKKLAPNHFRRSTWKILCSYITRPEELLSLATPPTPDDSATSNASASKDEVTPSSNPVCKSPNIGDDIILDEATPEQLAELEKLSRLIKFGNPMKQAKSSPMTMMYRAFQQRILNLLTVAPKLGLSRLQVVEYTADLVKYTVNFKPPNSKSDEKTFICKLLTTTKMMLHMKPSTQNYKCTKSSIKMAHFAANNFMDYSYRMRKNPDFLSIWFKWLCLLQTHLMVERDAVNNPSEQLATKTLKTLQMQILDDFLNKRNPLMKKDWIDMLMVNPHLNEETLRCMMYKVCECLCKDKLRGPQLVNITYVLSVALNAAAHKRRKPSLDFSKLIRKWQEVVNKSKAYPKNEKIATNLSNCTKVINKLSQQC